MHLAAILEKRNNRSDSTMTSIIMLAGLIGAAETIVAYFVFLLFPEWMEALFMIFGLLVLFTTAQRLIWAGRTL